MDAPPDGRERRLSLRLLNYWRDMSAGRPFARMSDLDGSAIPDMWPSCFILDCRAGQEPVFAYIGSDFTEWVSGDMLGKPASAAPRDGLLGAAAAFYGQVLRKRAPITLGGEFVDTEGRTIRYRSLLCPLSSDGETIDCLLGGANCRVVPQNAA